MISKGDGMPSPVATETSPAVATEHQSGITAWHRTVNRLYQFVYFFLGGNIVAGAIQSIIAAGGNGVPTVAQVQRIYFVQLAYQAPTVFWPVAGVLAFLAIAGPLYGRRLAAEEARQTIRQTETIATAVFDTRAAPLAEQLAHHEAEIASIKEHGGHSGPDAGDRSPPFDEDQLPRATPFRGRVDALAWLRYHLHAGDNASVLAICGIAGLGKSTLASEAASQLHAAGRFPDGIAVALCAAQRTPADGMTLLSNILARFHVASEAASFAQLADACRKLTGKQALVILDNVEPELHPVLAQIVAPLHAAGVAVLLTARQEVPRDVVPKTNVWELEVLSPDDALALFADAFTSLTPSQSEAARRIVAALGYHTLAIRLVAGYAADTRQGDLLRLAEELESQPQIALAIRGDNPQRDLEPVFASSYNALDATAQRLFAAFALAKTGDIGRQAALAIGKALGIAEMAADNALTLLKRRALVDISTNEAMGEESDRTRVRLHPLLRAFAQEHAQEQLTEADASLVNQALATFYATYANATADRDLVADEANIADAIEWAHEHDEGALVVQLCLGMRNFWRDRSRTAASRRFLPWGIAAAEAIANHSGEDTDKNRLASLVLAYGNVLYVTGQTDAAEQAFARSRALFLETGQERSAAIALSQLGDILLQRGDVAGAEAHYRHAQQIMHQVGDLRGEGVALGKLGDILLQRGDVAGAEAAYQQFQQIMHQVGDQQQEGVALYQLAVIAEQRGEYDQAEEWHRQSLAIGVAIDNAQDIADSLLALGRFLIQRRNNAAEGCPMLTRALQLYEAMGMPQAARARQIAEQYGCL